MRAGACACPHQTPAALLAACSRGAPTGIRNRALIVLLWRGGLRVSEALALKPDDLDPAAGLLRGAFASIHRCRSAGRASSSLPPATRPGRRASSLDDGDLRLLRRLSSPAADRRAGVRHANRTMDCDRTCMGDHPSQRYRRLRCIPSVRRINCLNPGGALWNARRRCWGSQGPGGRVAGWLCRGAKSFSAFLLWCS